MGIPKVLGLPSIPFDFYHWLEPVTGSIHGATAEVSHALEYGLMGVSIAVAVLGILVASHLYLRKPETADRLAALLPRAYRTLFRKYYVDEIYDALFVQPTKGLCRAGMWFDLGVIDGIVNGSAWMTLKSAIVSIWIDVNIVDLLVNLAGAIVRFFGGLVRKVQTGLVQNYGLISLYAFFVLLAFYLFFYM